jgi:hypothetical protein
VIPPPDSGTLSDQDEPATSRSRCSREQFVWCWADGHRSVCDVRARELREGAFHDTARRFPPGAFCIAISHHTVFQYQWLDISSAMLPTVPPVIDSNERKCGEDCGQPYTQALSCLGFE